MLLVGISNDGLSDGSMEGIENSNQHVVQFLGLSLEDDVSDHSVLGYKHHTVVDNDGSVLAPLKPLPPMVITASRCRICSIKPIFNPKPAFML